MCVVKDGVLINIRRGKTVCSDKTKRHQRKRRHGKCGPLFFFWALLKQNHHFFFTKYTIQEKIINLEDII